MTRLLRLRPLRGSSSVAALAAVMVGALLIAIGSTVPAGANGEQPAVTLTPDVPVHINGKALTAPGYAATRRKETEQTPDNCRSIDSNFCDVYPLKMNVPADEIATNQWIVLATLNWDPGTTVRNVPDIGDVSTTSYVVRIYYDPPCGKAGAPDCPVDDTGTSTGDDGQGDQYAAASATGTAPPAAIGVGQADLTRKMAVTVTFYLGQPKPYTLDIQLVKVGIQLPPDLSGDEDIPVGGGARSAAPAIATAAPPTKPPTTPSAPAVLASPAPASVPAGPSGPSYANGDLGSLNGVGGTSLGNDQLASLFAGKARAALPPPGDPSTLALILALLVLPLLALGLPTGWMWRRRRNASL